jgi:homoserine O-acetyltransferase/O-succinyltransferase
MSRSRVPFRLRRVLLLAVGCLLLAPAFVAVAHAQDHQLKFAELGSCKLESGQQIEGCRVGYRTFGKLNAAQDNAILMPTWLYGNSADLVPLFGALDSPHHLIDTGRYFGIAIDAFGNGVSSSPSNSTSQHGPAFPAITLGDSVRAQYRVMTEVMHLKHLHALVGLSMGGEQTFVWSVLHPEFFDLAIPILGTPRLTSYDLEVKQIMVESIENDPDYAHGHYTSEPALKLANLFGALVVISPAYRNQETPRDKLAAYIAAAEAPASIDANDRMAQLKGIMLQDVIGKRTLEVAARSVKTKFLIIVNAEDHLVNPQPALDWAAAIGAPTYISHGTCAHLIMTCDAEAVSTRVRSFLIDGRLAQN